MSICRWSHKSDVYIYQPADCGEEVFVIHVRGMTATEDSQDIPTLGEFIDKAYLKGWSSSEAIKQYNYQYQNPADRVEWKPLESIYSESSNTTTTWSVDSVEELADLLFLMQKDGVRIPPKAFAAVVTMLCEKEN